MERSLYLDSLEDLTTTMKGVENTQFSVWAKVVSLVTMNMLFENMAFNTQIKDHPYNLTNQIIEDTKKQFENFIKIEFIQSEEKSLKAYTDNKREVMHQQLWNEIWNRYDEDAYQVYIDRYLHRIKVNDLNNLIKDKKINFILFHSININLVLLIQY